MLVLLRSDLIGNSHRNIFIAMATDIKVGLTFSRIASSKPDGSQDRIRNTANARKAYETVLRLYRKLCFDQAEMHELSEGLDRLKSAIEALSGTLPQCYR